MRLKSLRYLSTIAIILALLVVMLGAYTRLTNAGLGCPDWPGCYGHMVVPAASSQTVLIESRKAWTEMIHRYAAGSLGLLIFALGFRVFWDRYRGKNNTPWLLPLLLGSLVLFQAALGMWTVTLRLLPVVVMGHLLGGMLIFSGLCYFRAQISALNCQNLRQWHWATRLGIVLVFCQIALGGWVSSNYAGVACIGFPQCNGEWLPPLHMYQGFNLISPVGANYQGGVLDHHVRVTIQFIHRLGAVVVACYILSLAGLLLNRVKHIGVRRVAILAIIFVLIQFSLGVLNVLYLLPLWIAVLHNGMAALLLATMVILDYITAGDSANG